LPAGAAALQKVKVAGGRPGPLPGLLPGQQGFSRNFNLDHREETYAYLG